MDKCIQKPVKYFIYYRIQDDYKSDESNLIAFADENELPIEGIYYDDYLRDDRLKEVIRRIRNNEAQGILCLNESSLTRSFSTLSLIHKLVNLNKIRSIIFTK